MIFCALGTHPQPFDRAIDWLVGARDGEPMVVQHGATAPRPGLSDVEWHPLLPYEDLVGFMREASVVVCHAGVGTLITALGLGLTPVALPRLRARGEHIDDHQLQIARALSGRGHVIACLAAEDVAPALAEARASHGRRRRVAGDLRRAAILAAGGDPARAGLMPDSRETSSEL